MSLRQHAHHPGTPMAAAQEIARTLHAGERRTMHQKHTLAGWISLIADDRGLDAAAVSAKTGLDREVAAAILDGVVAAVPLPVLDEALRRLENKPN